MTCLLFTHHDFSFRVDPGVNVGMESPVLLAQTLVADERVRGPAAGVIVGLWDAVWPFRASFYLFYSFQYSFNIHLIVNNIADD